ncbi:hypothetical protein [Parvularcula dongshanensis]|uniref:SHOCT domain-containing protein n=1 Tax=Parvularcula dongshanensis TaxID=1173995 RepID=A0A840I2K9_9PROT|nr:hypothetical protein [Parvularcula dongshanensis]MBB4658513.1 hypothetical protein [Parvularcula dongshanensis]
MSLIELEGPSVRQKRLSNRMWFAFADDALHYRFEDAQHALSYKVPYDEIPFTHTEYTEKFEALRAASFFWLALVVLNLVRAITAPLYFVSAAVLLGLAGLSWIGYQKLTATFTVIDTGHGRMLVLHDDRYEEVMHEIVTRRRAVLLAEHGDVDRDNDPEREKAKFAWLRARGVITEQEYQDKLAEVEASNPEALPPVTGPSGGTVH